MLSISPLRIAPPPRPPVISKGVSGAALRCSAGGAPRVGRPGCACEHARQPFFYSPWRELGGVDEAARVSVETRRMRRLCSRRDATYLERVNGVVTLGVSGLHRVVSHYLDALAGTDTIGEPREPVPKP